MPRRPQMTPAHETAVCVGLLVAAKTTRAEGWTRKDFLDAAADAWNVASGRKRKSRHKPQQTNIGAWIDQDT